MSDDEDEVLDDDPATEATLRALAPTLADPAVWSEPPDWMADTIVAAIAAERDAGGSAVPAPAPVPTADGVVVPMRPSRRRRTPMVWLAGAAAAAVIAIGVATIVTSGGDDGGGELALAGTELAPDAAAEVGVDDTPAGVAIRLDVTGLPPAPEGQYYAGWVRSDDGELVGIGSFHMRGGDAIVTLWAGVRVQDYPTLTVTIQTEGEGEASSGQVVMRGSLLDG